MGNFQRGGRGGFGGNRGGRGGGGRSGGFGGNRGGRDRDRASMHETICSDCGKSCEVPFRPTGEKPVYCSECFEKKNGDRGGRRDFNDRAPRKEFRDAPAQISFSLNHDDTKKQFADINAKLDKLIYVIEKFTQTKGEAASIAKAIPAIAKKIEKAAVKKASLVKKNEKANSSKKTVAKKSSAKKK